MGVCSKTVCAGVAAALAVAAAPVDRVRAAGSELSDEPIPMATEDDLPARTPPLIEIGPDFLGTGNLPKGIELPTGAVWNPALWVFGSYRTALNYFDDGRNPETTEWANRLDLFANLRLTGTERILFGMSPLRDESEFSGYTFDSEVEEGWDNEFNADITTLFFEGEIVEIFPDLDPDDSGALDLGFSVGRQPLFFQEGMMVNDTQDALGITRDTIIIPGLSVDTRVTALWAWNDVNRDDNDEDKDAQLFGVFTEGDWLTSTVQFDAAYVDSDNDGLYLGASSVQRMAILGQTVNTAFRANTSFALDDETSEVSDGTLLFAELSTTPHGTNNVLYGNAFWGIDEYSSASRDETAGGPLGQTGILFAAVGLGEYGSALSNRADNVMGAAIGYQMFFNDERTQVIFEAGGRAGTEDEENDQAAIGARVQQAIGDRFIVRADAFVSAQDIGDTGSGFRTEFVTRF
ncbi:hypothetical protein [Ferruginivarius sediminum]|uniref:Porin n=1 Tax=Ferruginivarius sediminum TaxID=2661937 RepID=A0A369TBK3_9PROT|nr:hypothetical protein [Ferruginivarius sediminum]RDD62232.1 hypothetical protein DRB17_08345 [Ferruginivarius sediminum]